MVKISSVNNLSDARYFAAFPSDWIGFDCHPISSKFIDNSAIHEIMNWLHGPKFYLNVEGLSQENIFQLVSNLQVEGLELSAHENSSYLKDDYTIFKRILIDMQTSTEKIVDMCQKVLPACDYIVLDFRTNNISFSELGLHSKIDEIALKRISKEFPIFIDIVFDENETNQILETKISGIDILSGEEEKAGLRSFEDIQDIMESLEI